MINYTGTYTDLYQLTMAQAYFLKTDINSLAVFDYFYRKNPFNGGYTIFAGLQCLVDILEKLQFDKRDIEFLESQNFNADFLKYLENFKFRGTIHSCKEGEVIFPGQPVLRIEAKIIEAQIIETLLLNILNFQSLIATKAKRMRYVAGERTLIDFGLRRAQGAGGYYASRAAVIGGFDATSNVKAALDFGQG